ncbi:MarR family winged helix-turn-helix transcriptional regulator [Youngiibacter multivorans]|uniref:DNA-binding MarR family transcriptional regulator n=1 Tax=Youngiibacter multivorans TaxID=937251 RepID=A0ABS4G7R4_9CLOT|nr:DNA-binding MarR family transcriptional regulator [Youngiibacter multivorans]
MKNDDIFKEMLTLDVRKTDEDKSKVVELYEKFHEHTSILYAFVLVYSEFMSKKKDYGTGDEMSMNEAHVLTDIVDNPGITVTELAKLWEKTTSALSQTVRKLINRDMIYRVNSKEDAKVFMLYPTQKAFEFNIAHKEFDVIDTIKTNKRLMKKFNPEELAIGYNVMKEFTDILREVKAKEAESQE